MNSDSLDLELPGGTGLPTPPPMDREAFWVYQEQRRLEFYQSEHYEAWYARTSEEMRNAKPFVLHD